MNILDFKRRALGYKYLWGGSDGGDSDGGGESSGSTGSESSGSTGSESSGSTGSESSGSTGSESTGSSTSSSSTSSESTASETSSSTSTADSTVDGYSDANTPADGTVDGYASVGGWAETPTTDTTNTTNTNTTSIGEVPSLSTPDYSLGTPANTGVGLTGTLTGATNPDGSTNYSVETTTSPGTVTGTGGGSGAGVSVTVEPGSQQVSLDGLSPAGLTQSQVDSWANMSPAYQLGFNGRMGLPAGPNYNYNHANPGWREALTDATRPGPGLLRDFGFTGIGVTPDQFFEYETPEQRDRRMELVGNVINRVAMTVMNMVPGVSTVMTGARMYDAVANKGMSFTDALKAGLFELGAGKVASGINKEVAKAIGPEMAGVLGGYNTLASWANLASPGSLPSANVGGYAVNALANAVGGVPSLGKPSGATAPVTGESIPGFTAGGWAEKSSGSDRGDSSPTPPAATPPAAAPVQSTPAADVISRLTNMRAGFDGAGAGRAIRAGAIARQQQQRANRRTA